jgi:hypothetical protein
MKCTHIKRLLPLYAGGDLSIQQADSVRAHLFACQHCTDLAIDFSESSAWLSSEGRVDFDDRFFDELRDSVWRSIRVEEGERSVRGWHYAWLLVFAAAAAVAVLAAIPLFRNRGTTAPPRREVAMETKAPEVVPAVADILSATVPAKRPGHRPAVHRSEAASLVPVVSGEPTAHIESFNAVLEEAAPSTNIIRRIEIQTADPTIRIIWLVRAPAAPVPTHVETDD